ncbi:hypothetical protein HID58_002673 [Brassica napus]|uniref:NmrA-like domain-containing protein n=1 Tax=Brassica napus TaxID=3708 RepID=A0ABQ8EMY7_BRANA|nr:hypothetical protein HID58_002673 [Brassica napus]
MTSTDQTTGTKKVCVIGGTGNLASILIDRLLQSGYEVNTTVRDPENEKKMAVLRVLQEQGDLNIFKADLTDEGSFNSPVSGCEYVFHVATPISFTSQDPERVIYTSSAAAVSINNLSGPGLVMTEENWSDIDFLRKEKPFNWAYPISKVLAEKAAYQFAQENKIDLVTVEMQKLSGSISFIHVDDLACAHLFLAEKETASGRYICCSYNTNIPELADFLRKRYPRYNVLSEFEECLSTAKLTLSSEKLINEGFQFEHDIEEMYDQMVEHFKTNRWA